MAGRLPSSQGDLLADPVRALLVHAVEQNPGISVQDIRRRFGLTKSALGHHRRVLVDAGILHQRQEGRHLVLTAWTSRTPTLATLRGTARKVAGEVVQAGVEGLTASETALRLGVSVRTARDHLRRLAMASLLATGRGMPPRYRPTEALRKLLAPSPDSELDEGLR